MALPISNLFVLNASSISSVQVSAGIDFILFHSKKLLLAFDSQNCCHGSALEVSDGVSE